jgi:UDP:flavonoid glycosyltransferase YjiC (YdhE family)
VPQVIAADAGREEPGGVRVMFVAAPMVGHVLPMVALAHAFAAAGHDVLVATAADGVDGARRTGLEARDVAPGLNMTRIGLGALLRSPGPVLRMVRGDEGTDGVGALFARVHARMGDGVRALAEQWRPELVLHEGLMPAGALAAARHGVPSVLVDALVYDGGELLRAVSQRLGAAVEPADVVTVPPPSLVGARAGRPMRFVAPEASGAGPAEPVLPTVRPTIVVTRSTVADPRRDRMMSTVVEAAERTDLDVVLVRPDKWVAGRPLPDNVRTTEWLHFADVFPHVAGVVHHGGSGTLLTALAAGVPQIVVPGPGDRTLHARLLAERGAGLSVPLEHLTAGALERLVGDSGLAAAAREVAAEIAAMPHPTELVDDLVALAR